MLRKITGLISVFLFVLPMLVFATSLNDVFVNAPAMAGYDRVLVLDPSRVYTGGIVIFNERVAIWGNGAVIDLQGNAVIAIGKGELAIDGCVFVNGGSAVSVADEVRTLISNTVFYGNDIGIQHFSVLAPLIVYNSVFMNHQNYGIFTNEENLTYLEYNVAYNNAGGHYMAGCGS